MFGKINFKRIQFSPTGTKVMTSDKLENRSLWASHGTIGWYIGPEIYNYIVHHLVRANKGSKQFSNMVKFSFLIYHLQLPPLTQPSIHCKPLYETSKCCTNIHPCTKSNTDTNLTCPTLNNYSIQIPPKM